MTQEMTEFEMLYERCRNQPMWAAERITELEHETRPNQMSVMNKRLLLIRAKWRLFWNLCPQCNSDAPELYDCKVCDFFSSSTRGYSTVKSLKPFWLAKYKALLEKSE